MSKKKQTVAKTVEQDDYQRWLIYEFIKMNTFQEIPQWLYKKLLESYKYSREYNFIQKFEKINRIKKVTYVDPVNYICTVFTVRDINRNIYANYGFLYSCDTKYANKIYNNEFKDYRWTPINYCISPSLVSTDGEYRNRLFRFGNYIVIAVRYAKIMETIEKFIAKKIETNNLTLEYENFFPQLEHEQLAELLDTFIIEHTLQIHFLCVFWLVEIYHMSINMQENHINPKYSKILFSHLEEDLQFFKTLRTKFGKLIDEMLVYCLFPILKKHQAKSSEFFTINFTMGQKLQPLKVMEVEEPLNIYFPPWRELYLSDLAADLMINLVCPSFAIICDWFYIKNSKKGMFDNEQQYQKIDFSERALMITKKLRESQHITYTRNAKTNERVYLNGMFRNLYDKIDNPIDYTKTSLLMSNVTLGYVVENVGRTFADIVILSKSEKWIEAVGDVIKTEWVFRKYIWDICYAILCLNVKLGVTHSDLHLNNCTINEFDPSIKDAKAHVIYRINDRWYSFRTHGPYAYIIDFSRGTIHPNRVENLPYWPNRSSYDDFVDTQNRNMINKLEQLFPTFMKINREKILELQHTQFDKFYRIYTAVDSYDFSSRIPKLLKPTKKIMELAQKIAKISEYYLTTMMLKIINSPGIDVEWPLIAIIQECFIDDVFDVNRPQDWTITDMWIFDRPEKDEKNILAKRNLACGEFPYSLKQFSCWPPILKEKYGIPAKYGDSPETDQGKYLINMAAPTPDELRLRYERYRKDQMKMVYYIAKRHHEKYT